MIDFVSATLFLPLVPALALGDISVGGNRPVTLHVPVSYNPEVPTPLVLFLHGYPGTGEAFESFFGFRAFQEDEAFLYAYPDAGLDSCGDRAWDATDACCRNFWVCPAVDDSSYLESLIDESSSELNVDAAQIFVAGQSAGGFMSYRMACDHADKVAAIASFAGATFNDPERCQPPAPVP